MKIKYYLCSIKLKEINIMATTAAIKEFIDTYGIEVHPNEKMSEVELKMDDHVCVEFDEVQYYVPKNDSFYSDEDYDIRDLLIDNYLVH